MCPGLRGEFRSQTGFAGVWKVDFVAVEVKEIAPQAGLEPRTLRLTLQGSFALRGLYGGVAGHKGFFAELAHIFRVTMYVIIRPVLLAVNSQAVPNERRWRTPMLGLCGLVFFFALHAKIAVYNGGTPVKVTPSTASKLWLNGQKLQIPSVDSSSGALFWMRALCLWGLHLQQERRVQRALLTPPPSNLALRHLHPFLRPPPVQVQFLLGHFSLLS